MPDSVTGRLKGLAGTMANAVVGGGHRYEFDYTLPASRRCRHPPNPVAPGALAAYRSITCSTVPSNLNGAMQSVSFRQPPEELCRPSRRRFLRRLAGGAAALAAWPADALAAATASPLAWTPSVAAGPAGTRMASPGDPGDERFWRLVRDQFPLRPRLALMNAANLCPAPYPVLEAVFGLTREVDADASFQNRAKFNDLHAEALAALAGYLGASPAELVITRNTSEGNNLVVTGLDLEPGDEVVIWDQNHPTNALAWDVRARRLGFTVRRVATPPVVEDEAQLIEPFVAAMTPRTRVLAYSEISNVTGVALPAAGLAAIARERGILTLVDGAQTFGFRRTEPGRLGFDFYTASAHKWFTGPKEAGVLWVRRERIGTLWPAMVGVGWRDTAEEATPRLGSFGQRDDATVAAMETAADWRESLDQDRAEARIRHLVAALRRGIADAVPGATFHTPAEPALSGGVFVVSLPGVEPGRAFETLYREHDIGCAAMRGALSGIRFCPSIYNTMDEVDRVAAALARLT